MTWQIRGGQNAEIYEDTGGCHRPICSLWGYGTPQGRRHARLLCAAPKMYSLLRELLATDESVVRERVWSLVDEVEGDA